MGRFESGFNWLLSITIIFVLVILHLIVVPAIKTRVAPELLSINGGFTSQFSFIFQVWDWTFYILMFVIISYMIINIFRRETNQQYGGLY